MPGASRLSDKSLCQEDTHGNDCCPHFNLKGPAIAASGNVIINGLGALRVGDNGKHEGELCCGSNEWACIKGSASVFINGLPAVRKGDVTEHCGGAGSMIDGSGNVIIGG